MSQHEKPSRIEALEGVSRSPSVPSAPFPARSSVGPTQAIGGLDICTVVPRGFASFVIFDGYPVFRKDAKQASSLGKIAELDLHAQARLTVPVHPAFQKPEVKRRGKVAAGLEH